MGVGTDWSQHTQMEKQTELRYSYRFICNESYYGESCSKKCTPRDDRFGHYTCTRDGQLSCLPGWKGKYCEERKLSTKYLPLLTTGRLSAVWPSSLFTFQHWSCVVERCMMESHRALSLVWELSLYLERGVTHARSWWWLWPLTFGATACAWNEKRFVRVGVTQMCSSNVICVTHVIIIKAVGRWALKPGMMWWQLASVTGNFGAGCIFLEIFATYN